MVFDQLFSRGRLLFIELKTTGSFCGERIPNFLGRVDIHAIPAIGVPNLAAIEVGEGPFAASKSGEKTAWGF
ncbi:MAG: hypothetical protein U0894_06600 [Pirellulales bacterium]